MRRLPTIEVTSLSDEEQPVNHNHNNNNNSSSSSSSSSGISPAVSIANVRRLRPQNESVSNVRGALTPCLVYHLPHSLQLTRFDESRQDSSGGGEFSSSRSKPLNEKSSDGPLLSPGTNVASQVGNLPSYVSPRIRRRHSPPKETRNMQIANNQQFHQYRIERDLGQGSFGLVKLAFNPSDGCYYALKILSKIRLKRALGFARRPPSRCQSLNARPVASQSELQSDKFAITGQPLDRVYKEIAILKKLDHPNIVKLVEVLDDPDKDSLYMVFEFVEHGCIMCVGEDDPFTEPVARKYFRDVVLGLEFLHYQKIIHRDIKPANLLLSNDDRVKISDFGVSNEFAGEDVFLTNTAGSPAFMAPESVIGGHYFSGKPLDIWALGVTLYCFLFGQLPFQQKNRAALYHAIIHFPIFWPENRPLSSAVLSLLKKMLHKDPDQRIPLPQIRVDNWVTQNGDRPLISSEKNCANVPLPLTAEDIRQSVRSVPRLQTLISIKLILRRRSFRNPFQAVHSFEG